MAHHTVNDSFRHQVQKQSLYQQGNEAKRKSITRGSNCNHSTTQSQRNDIATRHTMPIVTSGLNTARRLMLLLAHEAGSLATLPDRTRLGLHDLISAFFLIHRPLTDRFMFNPQASTGLIARHRRSEYGRNFLDCYPEDEWAACYPGIL